jgi:hypothetical protein
MPISETLVLVSALTLTLQFLIFASYRQELWIE